MSGPCMCGDPYCGSCGDPGMAEFEAFIDVLSERLSQYSRSECVFIVAAGVAALEASREAGFKSPEAVEMLLPGPDY